VEEMPMTLIHQMLIK